MSCEGKVASNGNEQFGRERLQLLDRSKIVVDRVFEWIIIVCLLGWVKVKVIEQQLVVRHAIYELRCAILVRNAHTHLLLIIVFMLMLLFLISSVLLLSSTILVDL